MPNKFNIPKSLPKRLLLSFLEYKIRYIEILKTKFLLLTILMTSLLVSCKSGIVDISKTEAIDIYRNITHTNPSVCIVYNLGGESQICCISERKEDQNDLIDNRYDLAIVKKFAGKWIVDTSFQAFSEEAAIVDIDTTSIEYVKINGKYFIYLKYSSTPQGSLTAGIYYTSYVLFSIDKFEVFTLVYSYDANSNKGEFLDVDKIVGTPEVLKFLEEKASKSKSIKEDTKEQNSNFENANNYEAKWDADNPSLKTVWNTEFADNEDINTTFYDNDIFGKTDFDSNVECETNCKIENENYVIIKQWRGNLLGYNKKTRKYFPIWVEHCTTPGCDKNIIWHSDYSIIVVYYESQNETMLIELPSMKYNIRTHSRKSETAINSRGNNLIKNATDRKSGNQNSSIFTVLDKLESTLQKLERESSLAESNNNNQLNPCKMYLARVGARNSYVVLKEILNEYYKNHLSEFDNRAIERKNKIEYNVNTLINVENEKVQLAKLACQ